MSCISKPKDDGNSDYNCSEAGTVHENVNLWFFFPILMIIYVPLVWIRDMRKLAWSHLLSNVLIFIVLITVICYSTDNLV